MCFTIQLVPILKLLKMLSTPFSVQELERWKTKAVALEKDICRLEAQEESRAKDSEQLRIAQVFRDLKWRQVRKCPASSLSSSFIRTSVSEL